MRRWLWAVPLLALAAAPVQAVPITWTLENVTLDDGAVASGWFVHDRDLDENPVTDWFLEVTGGDVGVFPPFEWSNDGDWHDAANVEPGSLGWLINFSGLPEYGYGGAPRQIRLVFHGELPGAYDTVVPLVLGGLAAECYACVPYRMITGGQVRSGPPPGPSPVPEPSALLLLGAGLAGLAAWRTRRS